MKVKVKSITQSADNQIGTQVKTDFCRFFFLLLLEQLVIDALVLSDKFIVPLIKQSHSHNHIIERSQTGPRIASINPTTLLATLSTRKGT